ncbi:MAG: Nif3-like dinuclear metal center hexameric protein [Prevotella sp.]|nr:Nif3-like dinuclear metal center hexameric protein [Prevotella sp.]
MKIRQIIDALEDFAPLALQDGYDNAGLQIGLPQDVDATGVLLCLDVTEAVVDEAVSRGCNMVVSHHPLLFHPLKSITGKDYVERVVIKAIQNGITLYAAHTNLDNAPGGVNHKMAEKLQLSSLEWLEPKQGMEVDSTGSPRGGSGLVGELPADMTQEAFVRMVKDTFRVDSVRYNEWHGRQVRRVAICGGAGAFLIPKAIAKGADAFITGEIGYHRFFGYEDSILLMELGHYESEQYTLEIFRDIISRVAPQLPLYNTQLRTNPIKEM